MNCPDPADPPTVGHLDTSRALSATLATIRGQSDVLPVLSAQFASKGDRDHFLAVVLSSFAKFLACKVKDPESYLLQWIALEQELSDAEEDSAGDDTDGDGSDVN